MAQLKDSVVTGSLRVTDTIYTTNETITSLTASAAIVSDANKNLVSRTILNNTSAAAVTGSDSLITANTLVNAGYVKSSGVTSVQVQASSPLQSSTNTAQNSSLNTTISFTDQTHNTILAGPASTSAANAAPTFRSLTADDIPTLTPSKVGLGNVSNNTYAGGTAVTLNGTSKAANTASFYAPTSSGDAGQVLISDGASKTPVWKTKRETGLIYDWTAVIQGQKWSRICYIPYSTATTGTSFLLNVRATRGSVVYNYTFIINVHHNSSDQCHINVLQGNSYKAIKIRGIVNTSGHAYIELYDDANSIASGTTQNVECNLQILTKGSTEPTLYTTFTDGTTLPSGFTAYEFTLVNKGGFQTNGQFTGNLVGDVTGNAATATRIDGNLTQLGNVSTGHNIWVSSNNSGSGIPNIIPGVYIVPNSKTIVASNFQGNATTATTAVSLETTTSTISGGSSGTHAQALQTYFNNNKASTPRNKLLAFYDGTGGNGSITFGYFLNGHDSSPYGGFFSAHYNIPYYVGINNGTFTQYKIWKEGDSVTGAVWNDYAEYRRANTTEPGRCVEENDNGILTLTKYRLIPGASIISDTWGFSQGESEEAKTPVAVSGRVLAYPYRNRDKYHAGQAVCSGPNGTVDIMTRREIQEYPDAIIGIVSEIPDYEEWGGGDRGPVKVNGRIWIKVR